MNVNHCLKLEYHQDRSEYANKHQNHKHRQQPPLPSMRNLNTQNYNRQLTILNKTKTLVFANSVSGDIQITLQTFANLFNLPHHPIKFYILPFLKSFHSIKMKFRTSHMDEV